MSLFKRIVSKLTNQPEPEEKQSLEKLGDSLKNADLDYKFAQLFTHSGGFFNYCADEAEALQTLNQIIKIEGINSIFCCDKDLQGFLNVVKVNHTPELDMRNNAAFITCEYLIAYDGRIPEKIIIMANVSQIVNNLNDAMGKIKRTGNIKNLTSISGNHSKLDAAANNNTKLFLLLLED